MLVNFDMEKLGKLLEDFYKISGITVSIWDADFNQLAFRPKKMPEFCRLIKTTEKGKKRCFESDTALCKKAYEANKPLTHKCHAGLFDTAAPIVYEDKLLGFVMFGQIVDEKIEKISFDELKTLCRDIPVDINLLYGAYNQLQTSDAEKIDSASRIIEACTYYLWLSQMIKTEQNVLVTQIDKFLKDNLAEKLSVEMVCKQFNLSRNKLYSVCSAHFNNTFNNYITKIRIKKAKQLLTTTDDPIYIICEKVGIPDYNYFSKVFKKEAKMSPLTYRKKFPLL